MDGLDVSVHVNRPSPKPSPPRQGDIWWSAAPPAKPDSEDGADVQGISDEQLGEWLSCTTGWEALELSWGALAGCGVAHGQLRPLLQAALAEAARRGAVLLRVRQLDVDEAVGRCLALALGAFPNFQDLELAELNLYDEAMGHLCGALHAAEALATLRLDSVWASEGGWGALAAAVRVNTSLRTLSLRECLRGPALPALCACLAAAPGLGSGLEAVLLGRNGLADAGVAEVCKALCRGAAPAAPATSGGSGRPSRIAHLDLSRNTAGRGCVPALVELLRGVRSLRRLDLSHNELGSEGARELCRALAAAPHLTSLDLTATGADDSAAEALARCLAASASAGSGFRDFSSSAGGGLTVLSLANNRLGSRGAAALAAAAKRPGCPLRELDLAGNGQVGEAGARAWADALASPSPSLAAGFLPIPLPLPGASSSGGCRLRRLVLSGCEVPDGGAFALGAALKSNSGLQELGLAENHITTRGLALLAEVLKANTSLQLLDVSFNWVGPQGLAPLRDLTPRKRDAKHHGQADAASPRVSSCVVKAELLPEYRTVEAVKHSREPWEEAEPDPNTAAAAATNPFGDPAGDAEALEAYRNPFLSPAESYVNPFLDPAPKRDRGPLLKVGSPGANPFLASPTAELGTRAAEDNPFLSPLLNGTPGRSGIPAVGCSDRGDRGGVATPRSVVEGRELATRVITKLGAGGSVASSDQGNNDQGARGGGAAGSSGSGSHMYVSSRSTADEGDLVTEGDLDMVDLMLQSMGLGNGLPSPPRGVSGSQPQQEAGPWEPPSVPQAYPRVGSLPSEEAPQSTGDPVFGNGHSTAWEAPAASKPPGASASPCSAASPRCNAGSGTMGGSWGRGQDPVPDPTGADPTSECNAGSPPEDAAATNPFLCPGEDELEAGYGTTGGWAPPTGHPFIPAEDNPFA